MEGDSSTAENSQLTAKELKDKEREELRREYRKLTLEVSELDEDNLKIEQLAELIKSSDALYGRVVEVQEAVTDAHMVCDISRLCRIKTEEVFVNAIMFKHNDFAEKLMNKLKGVVSEDGQVRIGHKRLVTLGKDIKSSFNRVPVFTFLNGVFALKGREKKKKKPKERKVRKSQKVELVSTQCVEVETVENTGTQTDRMVIHTLEHLVHQFRKNNKQPINYYNFIIDPKCFGTSVENMFHVSFLIKEGKARVILEDNVPYIRPVKPKKTGESSEEVKNQVVVNFNMYRWDKIIKEFNITECLIPRIPNLPVPGTSKS